MKYLEISLSELCEKYGGWCGDCAMCEICNQLDDRFNDAIITIEVNET